MKSISDLQKILSTIVLPASGFPTGNVHVGLPNPGMTVDPGKTALVVTAPQNNILSPKGATWG